MDQLRYVVLLHSGISDPHYDLMFETAAGSALCTWRSPEWPVRMMTPLTYLADHRREYLDYDGPVSGGRGHVRHVHDGMHEVLSDHPILLITKLENGSVLRLLKSDHAAQVLGA